MIDETAETARIDQLAAELGLELPTSEEQPLRELPAVARPSARLFAAFQRVLTSILGWRIQPPAVLADARHANLLRVLVERGVLTEEDAADVELGALTAANDVLTDVYRQTMEAVRREKAREGLTVASAADMPPPPHRHPSKRDQRRHGRGPTIV